MSAAETDLDSLPEWARALIGRLELRVEELEARLVRLARKKMTRLWAVRSSTATFFRITASRGRDIVRELLEGAGGVITSDRLASFLHLDKERWQVCWAHLLRDFESMAQGPCKGAAMLGDLLAMSAGDLFRAWKRHASGETDFAAMQREIEPVRRDIDLLLEHGPPHYNVSKSARRTCENLVKLGPALWTFTRIPGIEPTNNAAERALRPGVRWRKRSHGTMSARGSRFCERILTVATTLRQRGHNALDYIAQAIESHLNSRPPPPLPATG